MRILPPARLFLILTLLGTTSGGVAQNLTLSFLPEQAFERRYFADALAHQFSLSKDLASGEWYGNIGARIPLLGIRADERIVQVSAAGTIFSTLLKSPGHVHVYTADYLIDLSIDVSLAGNLSSGIGWGHISGHFADDGIVQLRRTPLNYVRDYISLILVRSFPAVRGKVYSTAYYHYHHEPGNDRRFTLQGGGDAGYAISGEWIIYGAVDVKMKSEVGNGTTQSYQLGIRYPSLQTVRAVRLALTHRRGYDERGQFFDVRDTKTTIGFFLDL